MLKKPRHQTKQKMKKYSLFCVLQNCKIFLALLVIILISSLLSFQMAEFACWLRQCDCGRYLKQETIMPHLSIKGKDFLWIIVKQQFSIGIVTLCNNWNTKNYPNIVFLLLVQMEIQHFLFLFGNITEVLKPTNL